MRPQGTVANASAMKPTSVDAQGNVRLSYMVTPKNGNCEMPDGERERESQYGGQSCLARVAQTRQTYGGAEDVAQERLCSLAGGRVAICASGRPTSGQPHASTKEGSKARTVDVANVQVGCQVNRVAL